MFSTFVAILSVFWMPDLLCLRDLHCNIISNPHKRSEKLIGKENKRFDATNKRIISATGKYFYIEYCFCVQLLQTVWEENVNVFIKIHNMNESFVQRLSQL